MKYCFYPGCAYESSGIPISKSIEATNPILNIEFETLEDWTCCGCPGAPISELGGLSLALRNLVLAQKTGLDLIAACSCCYRNLRNAHIEYTEDARIRKKLDEALGVANLKYNGNVSVRGLVDVYVNDVGLDVIASKVKRPLEGLKVACWYGCHQTRPFGPDDHEFPVWMDLIVKALGADPVPFPMKTQCCGGAQLMSQETMVEKLNQKLLDNARDYGAQAIVSTLCPLCFTNLDSFQNRYISMNTGKKFDMPILALSQIMGVAFGLSYHEVGLDRNIVSPYKVLSPYYKEVQEVRK